MPKDKLFWNFKDLELHTGFKYDWLTRNILFRPEWRDKLDADNGGPVFYPRSRGQKWKFIAKPMQQFLTDNFADLFRERVS
jgi:phage pi2 protein 07